MDVIMEPKMIEVSMRLATLAERLDINPDVEGFYLTWISRLDTGDIYVDQRAVGNQQGNIRSPYGGLDGIQRFLLKKHSDLLLIG